MHTAVPSSDERSPLERALLLFGDVRPGEGLGSVAMLASVFLLLAANYFVKPARDGLLASAGIAGVSEMELKAYSGFGQSLLLMGLVPLYCRLASRLPRRRLIEWVSFFFASHLVVFWLLQPGLLVDRVPLLGVVFYLWSGIFNVLVIAQFWSLAADLYAGEGGLRLFPAIAVGATAGSATGAWLAKELIRSGLVGTYTLLLVAAALLLLALAFTRFAESRDRDDERVAIPPCSGSASRGALGMVMRQRYLLAVAVVVLLANWVKTNSDNVLFAVVQEVVQGEVATRGIVEAAAVEQFVTDHTTEFYGDFFFWVNLAGLSMQALAASRLLRYGGLASILLALPLLSLTIYPILTFAPTLAFFRIAKIAEDSTHYSLQNTAAQVLWLPTTRETKYKAKAAIDTIVVRLGDGLAALTTFAGIHVLMLPVRFFFLLNSLLVAVWLVAAAVVVRENRALSET